MDIRPLDASDPTALAAWHATYDQAHREGLLHPAPWALEEMRAELLADRPGGRSLAFAGYVGRDVVVTGLLELPLMDNLSSATVDVATRPADRRRGHGSAMLAHLTRVARGHGRTVLQCEVSWNHDEPVDGAGTPGARFLAADGYTLSLADVTRVLDLPVDGSLLDRLAAEVAPAHAHYELRYFAGPVPEELIDRYGTLVGSLLAEAPQGDLVLEREVYDAPRIRADEALLEASGRRKHSTVALTPDGELVAYTDLGVADHDPGRAYQWGTLVRPDHRGHRLGLAVKVCNLRHLQAAEPSARVVTTWNAVENRHMVAVNEALGFRPVGRLGEFQRRL